MFFINYFSFYDCLTRKTCERVYSLNYILINLIIFQIKKKDGQRHKHYIQNN